MYSDGAEAGLEGITSASEACAGWLGGRRGIIGFDSRGCDERLADEGDVILIWIPYAEAVPVSYGGGGRLFASAAVGEAVFGR